MLIEKMYSKMKNINTAKPTQLKAFVRIILR